MYKPTVETPCHVNHLPTRAPGIQLTVPSVEERERSFLYKSLMLPEMNFWQRFKYLFTGKKPMSWHISHPPVTPQDINPAEAKKSIQSVKEKAYSHSYSTFAGCDIRATIVYDIGDNPTRKEVFRTTSPGMLKDESLDEYMVRLEAIHSAHCIPIGEIQTISVKTTWKEYHKQGSSTKDVVISVGDLCCIVFDRSLADRLNQIKGPMHLLLTCANEYGDQSTFVLSNFKVTSWSWGISVDDLVSEEHLMFEADEPMHWDWITNSVIEGSTKEE